MHTTLKRYKIDHISKKTVLKSATVTKKTLTEQDSVLFRQSIGKVRSVKSDKLVLKPDKKPSPRPKSQPVEEPDPLDNSVDLNVEKLSQEDKLSFLAPGLQKNVLRKLRKGYFGLDGQIDLHGLTSSEAKRQFISFLQSSIENGCRCVHIIHGKGYGSENYHPVLKNDLNIWLRQHKDVLAFCSTPPREGGTGAVFVLLKLSEKYGEQDDAEY